MGYNIYLGLVVGTAKAEDNRLQIKILPQMENIADSQCPLFPFFFKDELMTGNYGELVWCVCDDEFSIGYILGLANDNTYSESTSSFKDYSLSETLKETISNAFVNLKAEVMNYNDIKVTYWNDNCIHFIEKKSGGLIIAFSSGTLYVLRSSEFIVQISNTKIKFDSEGISFNGPKIDLQSENVGLGLSPSANVLITSGSTGEEAQTSAYVKA